MSETVVLENPKDERRKAAREIRDCMPESVRKAASDKICAKITAMASFHLCNIILCYYPIGSEVDIIPVINEAMRLGKTVGLSVCDFDSEAIEFYKVTSLDKLEKRGKLQIPSPDENSAEKIMPDNSTMVIVPGLLFDKSGRRIGYGKGMYDRYIRRYPVLLRSSMVIGVSFAALMSDIPIPYTDLDVSVSLVVTENGLNFTRRVDKSPKWEVRQRRRVPLIDEHGNEVGRRKKDFYCANYVAPDEGKYIPPKAKDIIE